MSFAIDDAPTELWHVRDGRLGKLLTEALKDPQVQIVAHNASYEILTMLAHSVDWRPLVFAKLKAGGFSCTMLREKLLRIGKGDRREGFGLDDCLEAHGIPIKLDKQCSWRVRFGSLYGLDVEQWPQEAVDYAKGDIAVRDLWRAQAAQGDRWFVNEHPQVEAAVALALSSAWGLRTDPVAASKLYDATVTEIELDRKVLAQAGLLKFKPDGSCSKDKAKAEQMLVDAYRRLGKSEPRGEPTEKMLAAGKPGNVKLDEEACLGAEDEILAAYTRYGQANTLLSKIKRLQHPLIQPSMNTLVATGRTSCRQGDDPKPGQPYSAYVCQIQNPPRAEGVRECFVARPGYAFVSIDFNQAELRTWAAVCKWLFDFSDLGEVLKDPARDPHVELGALIYGLSVDEAYALKKTDKPKFKELRQLAKAAGFGLPGGLGKKTFIEYAATTYGVKITEARAAEVIAAWKRKWREAAPYLEWVADQLGRRGARGEVTHFVSQRVRGDVSYCEFANSLFQGLAADAGKAGFVKVMYACYADPESPVYGCRMQGWLHDEWLGEVPLEGLHEKSHHIRDLFCSGADSVVKEVPMTAEPSAMLRWTKAASDPVYENGVLIPWELRK
jgi:DNA polymerase-1